MHTLGVLLLLLLLVVVVVVVVTGGLTAHLHGVQQLLLWCTTASDDANAATCRCNQQT
jgi:hypothetical protein